MDYQITFKVNDKIYLRDPESSDLGRQIVKSGIDLIYELGFEHFTFKKLALKMGTTEASIYRYFENKHRLLLYILNWYWSYIEFLLIFQLQNVKEPKAKLKMIIQLLTNELPESTGQLDYNKNYLNQIIIAESSKAYLVKEVSAINKDEVFKPYKDLCAHIAKVISDYKPSYKFPTSLSSTIIETSHYQQFFVTFLPRLTDASKTNKKEYTALFIEELLFKVLA
jgi:hypothetical protein